MNPPVRLNHLIGKYRGVLTKMLNVCEKLICVSSQLCNLGVPLLRVWFVEK